MAGCLLMLVPWHSFALARLSLLRKRRHEEWLRLDIA
jgi:hypothetical protein